MNVLPRQLRFDRRPRTSPASNGQPPQLAPARKAGRRRSSPVALGRRLAQPLPLIGIVLLAVSAVGYIAVAARARTHSSDVVVAAHNLPAGTRLTTADLRLVKLSAAQELLAQLVPAKTRRRLSDDGSPRPHSPGFPSPARASPNRAVDRPHSRSPCRPCTRSAATSHSATASACSPPSPARPAPRPRG